MSMVCLERILYGDCSESYMLSNRILPDQLERAEGTVSVIRYLVEVDCMKEVKNVELTLAGNNFNEKVEYFDDYVESLFEELGVKKPQDVLNKPVYAYFTQTGRCVGICSRAR